MAAERRRPMTKQEYRQMKKAKEKLRRQMEREAWEAARGPMDMPFFLLAMILLTIGMIMLLSASFPSAQASKDANYNPLYYFQRQAMWAGLGLFAMFWVSKINYHRFEGMAKLGIYISVILLVLVIRSGHVLKPHPRYFTFQGWVYKEILSAGMPTLGRQGLASVASVLLNVASSGFGDAAVAAMSIVTRIMMFINSALIGFGQGFQPVCGFNFGAGRYDRVLEAYFFCRRVALVFLLVMGVIMFAISTPIMRLFRKEDAEVIRIGALALKMQCCLLPFQSYTIIGNMLTQSIGYSFRATLTAISKQGLFFIPAILILPSLLGILGLQLAQPVADGLTFVLTQVIVVMVVKELRGMAASQNAETE